MSVPTQNDCTGDYLLSKAATDNYRDNYDAIFGKKVKSELEVAPIKKESKSMKEVKRYDAVHIRYEESNIRYGEGCEVEVVTSYDYDTLLADRDELLVALQACVDYGSMTGDESITDNAIAAIAKARGDV